MNSSLNSLTTPAYAGVVFFPPNEDLSSLRRMPIGGKVERVKAESTRMVEVERKNLHERGVVFSFGAGEQRRVL
ncbi:MAG: hypothetical protein ACKOW9_06620 [Candidatus Paceibacterota bacterium]